MFVKFLCFLVLACIGAEAMVCFKGICDKLPERGPLNCEGSVIKNGGFCRCFDVCAKQEGETCEAEFIRGRPQLGTCDKGLTCKAQEHMIIGAGKCVKSEDSNETVQKPERSTRTLCEQRRISSMISMVVYRGQWFPKCDTQGLFVAEQCDNIGQCFCVDVHTGVVDETTKVLGSANC
ncbi:uncharacterized protein LOC123535064 [Mercenaria mercenaria]|uniref:uncharacterized protein LOC123535064 n=1 Tax=Mercenaria mercenaria TaxID=6596 RepID=UPI00234E9293|nr:uncharacterized protein LOC123535064 [Mercenaria mercenaria]